MLPLWLLAIEVTHVDRILGKLPCKLNAGTWLIFVFVPDSLLNLYRYLHVFYSWSARFCTSSTSTWWPAIISGCSAKESISIPSLWWPCSLRHSACAGITCWAGVCISSSWVLSHICLCLYAYSLFCFRSQRTESGAQVLPGKLGLRYWQEFSLWESLVDALYQCQSNYDELEG